MARRLTKTDASLSMPPVVEKTKGVNVPFSMSMTRVLYFRFFSFS